MNIDDRRVRKTKKALQKGLAELMLEKELRNITVKELSDKADVHRATFYAHYQDIYDLYEQLENTVVDELKEIISSHIYGTYNELFKAIIDYVYNNSHSFRMLFCKSEKLSFYNRISIFLEEEYMKDLLAETGKSNITEEWRILVKYHIQGSLAIISHWAENDYSYPKDKLTDLISNVSSNFDAIVPE